jgi:hypothetical protein
MAMILAFNVVAPRERWLVQWAGRDASVKSAECSQSLPSTEVAYPAVYHRIGDCHATPISLRDLEARISLDPPAKDRRSIQLRGVRAQSFKVPSLLPDNAVRPSGEKATE